MNLSAIKPSKPQLVNVFNAYDTMIQDYVQPKFPLDAVHIWRLPSGISFAYTFIYRSPANITDHRNTQWIYTERHDLSRHLRVVTTHQEMLGLLKHKTGRQETHWFALHEFWAYLGNFMYKL